MDPKVPPILLGDVIGYMRRAPDVVFVFIDKKAAITYYGKPFNTVVYFVGDFKGNQDDVTEEMHRAAVSMLN